VNASTDSSQETTECPSTGCSDGSQGSTISQDSATTGAPTGAPTSAPTEAKTKIQQAISYDGLTASDWTGDTKKVNEVAMAIGVKVYDKEKKAFKEGCAVDSAPDSSRRALKVKFEVTVAAALASVATAAADTHDPAAMRAAIAEANTALSTSVPVPSAASMSVAPPVIITAAPTAAPTSVPVPTTASPTTTTSSSSSSPLIFIIVGAIAAVVIVALCGAAFYFMGGSAKSVPPPMPAKTGIEMETSEPHKIDIAQSTVAETQPAASSEEIALRQLRESQAADSQAAPTTTGMEMAPEVPPPGPGDRACC